MAPETFAEEPSQKELDEAFYSDHDLREMYDRANTERRRTTGHTLRKYLTQAQDRKMTSQFCKIRDEYEVANNNDAVVVFVRNTLEAKPEEEFDERLLAIVDKTNVPKRSVPLADVPA